MPARRPQFHLLVFGAVAAMAGWAATGAWPAAAQSGLLAPVADAGPARPGFRPVMPGEDVSGPSGFGSGTASPSAGRSGFNSRRGPPLTGTTAFRSRPMAAPAQPAPVLVSRRPQRRGAPEVTGSVTPYPSVVPVRRRPPEEEPFAALGWRAGAFLVLPAIDLTAGYDTNPARRKGGTGSAVTTVASELVVRSDWSRHALNAELRGSYTTFASAPDLNRPLFNALIDGRIDVSRDLSLDLQARGAVGTDNPGNPNTEAGLSRLPVYTSTGATVGLTQRLNRLEISAKALADRTAYGASSFTDGTTFDNRDRSYNQVGFRLRAGYETVPGFKPFVEVETDRRLHDEKFDRAGFERDSTGRTARVGVALDLPRGLRGEVSGGYTIRDYRDPALRQVKGFVFDGSLVWAATGLTNVTLTAKSSVNELIRPGESGYLSQDVGVQVDHAFRRWLVGSLRFGVGFDTYECICQYDQRYALAAALTYKATRTVQIKGEVRREMMRSNDAGRDYTADIVLLGVRLQR